MIIISCSRVCRWYINDKKAVGDYKTEMVIHNVTRDYHDAIVKCEVYNDVGKSEETKTLDVTCEYISYTYIIDDGWKRQKKAKRGKRVCMYISFGD